MWTTNPVTIHCSILAMMVTISAMRRLASGQEQPTSLRFAMASGSTLLGFVKIPRFQFETPFFEYFTLLYNIWDIIELFTQML